MSTNKTKNLNLHSWEPTDPVRRAEFNENWAAIDAGVGRTWAEIASVSAATPRFAAGTYDGDGNASRTISLGFTPKAVYVCLPTGNTVYGLGANSNYTYWYGGMALTDHPVDLDGFLMIEITTGGFILRCGESGKDHFSPNDKSMQYYYVAIG